MRKICVILAMCLTIVELSPAQIKVCDSPGPEKPVEIDRWEVADLVYHVRRNVDDPFGAEAFAVVGGEEGEQRIPLFFNGDKQWVFRYSSAVPGKKTFVLESELKDLDGKKGILVVGENRKPDRHGGIVLKEDNPRHFFYEDGSHYFNLAFECDWLFALDYGDEDIPKTRHLLSLLNENGYNQVVMNVYAYDVDTNWVKDPLLLEHPEHNYGSREDIFPYLGSNADPDYSSLNVDFFTHFDRVIAAMHEEEILSHLMIYVWNKLVNWPELGSAEDNMYYDYVIRRYQAFPNIIWDVSKEATNKIALERNQDMGAHIAERIVRTRELDAFNRLVSVHAYSFCRKHRDLVDFISIQHWRHRLYDFMLDAYKEFPDKPVFNIEHGGYEESPYAVFPGAYTNAEACLRRNYMCLFAGCYTTYYWQGAAWSAIIHDPFEQSEGSYKPHWEYFKYMRGLFDAVNFENFEPMPGYSSSGYNLTNYKDGMILMYAPKESHYVNVQGQLEDEFDYGKATWQWFNTLTGEYTEEVPVEFPNKYGFWDWRPWRMEADAILVVRNLEPKDK